MPGSFFFFSKLKSLSNEGAVYKCTYVGEDVDSFSCPSCSFSLSPSPYVLPWLDERSLPGSSSLQVVDEYFGVVMLGSSYSCGSEPW